MAHFLGRVFALCIMPHRSFDHSSKTRYFKISFATMFVVIYFFGLTLEGSSPCRYLVFTKRVRERERDRERGYRREDKKIVANWSPVPSHGRPRAETFRFSACSANAPQYACSALPYWHRLMCEDGLPPGTSSSDYGFWRHNIHSHAREIIMTTRRDRNFAFVSIDQNLDREKCFLTLLFEIVLIRIYICF